MTRVSYYAHVGGGRSLTDPTAIIRRTAPAVDESFHRDLHWRPTERLRRYWLGHNDDDVDEITAAQAHAIMRRWRVEAAEKAGRWPPVGANPIRYDQTGLHGRLAMLLTDLPTNDAGVPVDLPRGTTHVEIIEDTPNATLTLQAHPVGEAGRVVFIDHAQLALVTDDQSEQSSS
ncbi:DUF7161 family protein [Mycolicibacterium septicum]|uniref:Uncharacterized protein n=1 Tax=Mycolicibacterium septicum TaxID=98668 RepID=A0ABW9M7F9_9MYCO